MTDAHIQIEISVEQLHSSGVAQAMADLMLALGGQFPLSTTPNTPFPSVSSPTIKATSPHPPVSTTSQSATPKPTKSAPTPPSTRISGFAANLAGNAAQFLAQLEARGTLTITQAMTYLRFSSARAVGGLVGSIQRKAKRHGVALPYTSGNTPEGERFWQWNEQPTSLSVSATSSPSSEAPQPTTPGQPPTWEELVESLPNNSKAFLALLKSHGTLSTSQAIELLGFQNHEYPGKAFGGTLGAIGRKANKLGLKLPYTSEKTASGERMFKLVDPHTSHSEN